MSNFLLKYTPGHLAAGCKEFLEFIMICICFNNITNSDIIIPRESLQSSNASLQLNSSQNDLCIRTPSQWLAHNTHCYGCAQCILQFLQGKEEEATVQQLQPFDEDAHVNSHCRLTLGNNLIRQKLPQWVMEQWWEFHSFCGRNKDSFAWKTPLMLLTKYILTLTTSSSL